MKLTQIEPATLFLLSSFHVLGLGVLCESKIEPVIAVKNFQDYLRINTAQPKPNYERAIDWTRDQAKTLGLEYNILRYPDPKELFAVWLTWPGTNPKVDSLFLYSHIDTVPVEGTGWKYDPFAGAMDKKGNIFGRGAQDMKSAAVQYLEAVRSLNSSGWAPNRTIHIGFIPDEEVGTGYGMPAFVQTAQFKALNVGLTLDEGLPNDQDNVFKVYYGQRTMLWMKVIAHGSSGHGSLLLNNTAAEKLQYVINKLLAIREQERLRYNGGASSLSLGDVTSINLNMLEFDIMTAIRFFPRAAIQVTIIPSTLSATFDIRIPPQDFPAFEKLLNETCVEAGSNVTYEVIRLSLGSAITELNETAWWWKNFHRAFDSMNITIVPSIFPAGTDGQYARNAGTPTLGFSPIFNSTMLFHARDEHLNVDVFLKGIEIYEKLIRELAYYASKPDISTKNPEKANHAAKFGIAYEMFLLVFISQLMLQTLY